MTSPTPGRRKRIFRRVFRWCRITVLLLVLAVVAALTYLNEVGLPDFLKRPLLARLREQGVNLQFTRLRLRFHRGIVAENVRFGEAGLNPAGPTLIIKEVQLDLNHSALARFQFNIDALVLHGGELVWHLEETNEPPLLLAITNIQTQLDFLPGDRWELGHFTAGFAGAKLHASGIVTNASAVREWKLFQPGAPTTPGATLQHLRDAARIIQEINLEGAPELVLELGGDARDPRTFSGLFTVNAPGAETPWGTFTNGAFLFRVVAPNSATNQPQARLELRANGANSRWGSIGKFQLNLRAEPDETKTNIVRAQLEFSAAHPVCDWGKADTARLTAIWTNDLTNPVPVSGTSELTLSNLSTRWGGAGSVNLDSRIVSRPSEGPPDANPGWGFWAALEPYFLDWNCRLRDVRAENSAGASVELGAFHCSGTWRAPDLTFTNIHSDLYDGSMDARATLNVATRALDFEETSNFEVKKIVHLLGESGQRWMSQYTWEKPPLLHASGGLILPAWTNLVWDWGKEVMPTLWLKGDLSAGNAGYRGVPFTSAKLHFDFADMVWDLPDLVATRPEGVIKLAHISDEISHHYSFRVHSTADVKAARDLLKPAAQHALDFFAFTKPPVLDAEIWGYWHQPERTGVKAHVEITNFTFRGESVSNVHADIRFTNDYVIVTNARVEREEGFASAEGIGIDIAAHRLFLTNGLSTLEPGPFFRVIGPKVAREMEPYHFEKPPNVQAHGTIPLDDQPLADAHFKIDGGPFHWLKFHLDHVGGGVDWVADRVALTNVKAAAYQGQLGWDAAFAFTRERGTDFSFGLSVTNANLRFLMADVYSGPNNLEGTLSGRLDVARANAEDWRSWFGNGHASLRDGLIWDIPVFGIFSPVLDGISPGLGKSRATDAAGTFTITNSVIRSSDLEIRGSSLHMLYDGSVDFDGTVNAKVEAKLFRSAPVVGGLFDTMMLPFTKLFEYKVTGTLSQPKSEPLFLISRIILMPFSPVQSFKEFVPAPEPHGTYAPPPPITNPTLPATNSVPATTNSPPPVSNAPPPETSQLHGTYAPPPVVNSPQPATNSPPKVP